MRSTARVVRALPAIVVVLAACHSAAPDGRTRSIDVAELVKPIPEAEAPKTTVCHPQWPERTPKSPDELRDVLHHISVVCVDDRPVEEPRGRELIDLLGDNVAADPGPMCRAGDPSVLLVAPGGTVVTLVFCANVGPLSAYFWGSGQVLRVANPEGVARWLAASPDASHSRAQPPLVRPAGPEQVNTMREFRIEGETIAIQEADMEAIRRAVLDRLASDKKGSPNAAILSSLAEELVRMPIDLRPDVSQMGRWHLMERGGKLALARIPPRSAMNYLFVAKLERKDGRWFVSDFDQERMKAL